MRRSILAEQPVLDLHHCTTERIPVQHVVSAKPNEAHNTDSHIEVLSHPSGWKFHSFHRHILNERERKDLAAGFRQQLRKLFPSFTTSEHTIPDEDDDDIHWDNFKLHIPPMLFARDIMRFDFKSRGSVNISAQDALFCWLCQHVPEVCEEHPLNVVQVPYAKKWVNRLANIQSPGAVAHHHATIAHGITPIQETSKHTAHAPASASTVVATHVDAHVDAVPTEHSATTITTIRASDWTYTTDYCCTLTQDTQTSTADRDHHLVVHGQTFHQANIYPLHHDHQANGSTASSPSPWMVTPQATCGIDYDMLRRRDLPILFYDEMTLYEDDLEDCGEVSVEAKVRVMPNCWFALVRCFLRIDQVIVRCRETRLYHVFSESGEDKDIDINVEVLWREKSLTDDAALFPTTTTTKPAPTSATTAVPTTTMSPAATAAIRAAQGGPLPPALLAAMQGTARAAMPPSVATTAATATGAPPHLPSSTVNVPFRYTKENAGEVLPRVNDTQNIPSYYTFSLRQTDAAAPVEPESTPSASHHRHLHWFGLAAAHGIRK